MRVSCAVFRVAAPVVRGRVYLVGHAFVGGAHPAGARGLLAAEKLRTEFSLSGTYGKTRCMSVCVMQRVFSRWRIPAGTVPQRLVAARLLLVEEVHGPFYTDRGERKNGVAEDLEPFGQRFAFLGRPFAQHVVDLMAAREVAAHAEPHPCEILAAQQLGDVLQPVVAAGASPLPDAQRPERQGDVVRDDQQVFARNLLGVEPVAHRLARQIHVGRGLEQHQGAALVLQFGHVAVAGRGKKRGGGSRAGGPKLLNQDLIKLLNGEEIDAPTFNFHTGHKEYRGNKMRLGEDEVLVMEGIHCLNDELTYLIPKEQKFKIYISALTVLNMDYYNRISTTDTRLIRRIVRDNQFRGYSAKHTLEMWESVKSGELKNIFKFQEEADAMFNSSLIYELGVLKKYAEPLLKEIEPESPLYSEAKRLLTMLKYFKSIPDKYIPIKSLLREFIGGSVFEETN